MNPPVDLDAYLGRIAWRGPTAPSLRTLAGLLLAHMDRIPFENLDVLLGRAIRLDLPSLQRKLVHERRGGYCFEHATLFAAVLESLGFDVRRHTARVIQFTPRELAPRSHMFLAVTLPDGEFVVDPGFGGLSAPFPVPLGGAEPSNAGRAGATSAPGHQDATHWLARENGIWLLRARTPGRIVDCWISTLEAENAVDFDVSNHYTATHPGSPFRQRILMQARRPGGRATIRNRTLTLWQGDAAEVTELRDRRALREAVARHFGFDLPAVETLRVPDIPEWD